MDRFDIFVLPFTAGLVFVVFNYVMQVVKWIRTMPLQERKKLKSLLLSPKRYLKFLREVIKESLLHVNLFKTNPLLGFMHSSLALGWFMLIVVGNMESKVYTNSHLNPPYYPIFLKYFIPDMSSYPLHRVFAFTMDFFLLLVLTGVSLAIIKRFTSKKFSIARKPSYSFADKAGLISLWFVFPCRYVAESIYAGIHHSGGFLTQTTGDLLFSMGATESAGYTAWWMYSLSLGAFFFTLPFTRYMHILSEPFFIFIRHAGVDSSKIQTTYNDIQTKCCSKCGVCLNACPLAIEQINTKPQPIYILDALRKGKLTHDMADSCLNCKRCEESCPVGITIEPLRMVLKQEVDIMPDTGYIALAEYPQAKIGYFSGCMGRLTPSTTAAMLKIAKAAGDNLVHLDKDISICCGRPQKLVGQHNLADDIVKRNTELLTESKVALLITSCPICLKSFKESYDLKIPVLHHTQYIARLLEQNRIDVTHTAIQTAYHDPCELARGCGVTKEPRYILKRSSVFKELPKSSASQCCGNSLAHNNLKASDKRQIASITLSAIPSETNMLITSCPACNKAFKGVSETKVLDIAVFTAEYLSQPVFVSESLESRQATSPIILTD